MVEELKFLIEAQKDYDRRETQSHWKTLSNSSHRFLRDHGQALVECVEDAERWRTFRHLTSIMDPSFVDSFEGIVPDSDDPEDVIKAMDTAIDLARTKASAGGGV